MLGSWGCSRLAGVDYEGAVARADAPDAGAFEPIAAEARPLLVAGANQTVVLKRDGSLAWWGATDRGSRKPYMTSAVCDERPGMPS